MTTDVVFELHNEQESMLFEMMLSLERDFELDSWINSISYLVYWVSPKLEIQVGSWDFL